MPFPVLIVIGVGTGVAGIYRGITGVGRIKKARRRYDQRRADYETAENNCRMEHEAACERLEEFGKQKAEAAVTLGEAATFIRKAKVKQRQLFEKVELSAHDLATWEGASIKALEILGGVATSAVSGALTAAGIYGLVSGLATASTGTAIATLSGIAAQNATLAWLGGGALAAGGGGVALGTVVLGSLIAGPSVLVGSFFMHAKASKVEKEVERCVSEMDVAEAKMQKHLAYLQAVLWRVGEIAEAVAKVHSALRELLKCADESEMDDVYRVAKVAKRLGELLDAPVIDTAGNPITERVDYER